MLAFLLLLLQYLPILNRLQMLFLFCMKHLMWKLETTSAEVTAIIKEHSRTWHKEHNIYSYRIHIYQYFASQNSYEWLRRLTKSTKKRDYS